ncbi:MAG: glycosyltransferase [Prochlorococcaceae cyanobacterium]
MTSSLLIVVPTLNSHPLLPRLVSSLQSQTMRDWRLLFIDGPSGPDHREWLSMCCAADSRCTWVEQDPDLHGIFGAMSQGFAAAHLDDWVLFWGSDDWASSNQVLSDLINVQSASASLPDLVVCSGRYVSPDGQPTRASYFDGQPLSSNCNPLSWVDLSASGFRRSLFLGATPPHQATLFGPGAIQKINSYRSGFRLAADLDYFLRLATFTPLCIRVANLQLVHMTEGGVSAQQTRLRLEEVRLSYQRAFGSFWFLPFLFRYVRRIWTLLRYQ